jgi:hypothetical protein
VPYAFLDLPNMRPAMHPEMRIDKWSYSFREAKGLNVVPPELSEALSRDALKAARTATLSPEERDAYGRARLVEQDARGALIVAATAAWAMPRWRDRPSCLAATGSGLSEAASCLAATGSGFPEAAQRPV